MKYRELLKDSKIYLVFLLFQNLKLGFGKSFFSQTGEDKLIAKWLPETFGLYIDVGAGQPVRGSNTYHFYKRGWRGILVEPIANNYWMLKVLRKSDTVIRCLVSTTKGTTNFYEFVPYEYSTTIPAIAEKLKVRDGVRFIHVLPIKALPLSELAPEMNPEYPTLLSVDVEGADFEVLQSNDWTKTLPRVICVEELDSKNTESNSVIRSYLENLNYTLVATTSLSSIFVHTSYLVSID